MTAPWLKFSSPLPHRMQISKPSRKTTPTINMTTKNRVSTIHNTETKVTAQTPRSPSNTAHKLSETQTRNLSIHLIVEQTYIHDMLIEDMLVIFRCVETFPPVHQFHPPNVFIESEHETPWEPRERRYITMHLGFRSGHEPGLAKRDPPWGIIIVNGGNFGLEDKAVFQDGRIDMSPKPRTHQFKD
nr:hypothetical protein [Tanacetum cinerariifolium]